jgi:hypothetical protein
MMLTKILTIYTAYSSVHPACNPPLSKFQYSILIPSPPALHMHTHIHKYKERYAQHKRSKRNQKKTNKKVRSCISNKVSEVVVE